MRREASVSTKRMRLSPAAVRRTPGLAAYRGRELVLGIRPEHFVAVSTPHNGRPLLRGEVTLVEALGSERLVHFEMPGTPVLTAEVIEVVQDIDAAAVKELERDSQRRAIPAVARMDTTSTALAGHATEIGVDVERLRFFDLETGVAIS